jgi:thiamine biosynthesis lipoprotein
MRPFLAADTALVSALRPAPLRGTPTLQQFVLLAAASFVWLCLTLPILAFAQSPPPSEPDLSIGHLSGQCMGPIKYNVTIVDSPKSMDAKALASKIQSTLDRINQLMSTYIDESDISKFNASDSTEFIPCDAETAAVVKRAIEISELTGGAFDVTVGPAVELWSFGRKKLERGEAFEVPDGKSIETVKQKIGFKKLKVRLDPPALKKLNPALQINLSAIAKGYAVDCVAQVLDDFKCPNYMVEVGGETRAKGHRQNRQAWRVGIQTPDTWDQSYEAIALISEGSVATSGDYRNYRRVGKKRYSHTINPLTARPVEHSLASACVLAGDCMTADAMATACMVMGQADAKKLLEKSGFDYHLIGRTGDFSGQYKLHASETFPFANEASREKLVNHEAIAPLNSANSIWPVFLAAAMIFGLVILAMAVGAIFNNKPVKGSCGGLANVTNEDGESSCGICSKPVTDCDEWQAKNGESAKAAAAASESAGK